MSEITSNLKKKLQSAWDTKLQPIVRRSGFDIQRHVPPLPYAQEAAAFTVLRRLHELSEKPGLKNRDSFLALCANNLANSKAQLFQDLFVLHELDGKREGYFVEFGATNGVDLSNTHLLEKQYGWHGLLAEPARCWHDALQRNRSSAIDFRCVWEKNGERLEFNEVPDAAFSTIAALSDKDFHSKKREHGTLYEVETVLLNDLLKQHDAPRRIDYMSIDTEGSEYDILKSFDFAAYDVRIITVEHNYTEHREKIYDLLGSNGYQRKFEEFSGWDDWYVKT